MLLVPVIEPAVPVFHAHHRLARAEFPQRAKVSRRVAAEIDRGQHPVQGAAPQHEGGRPVGGKQQAVHPVVPVNVRDGPQIILIVAVAAVFVFHLHRHDVPPVGGQPGRHMAEQLLVIPPHLLEKQRIVAPQPHVPIGQQPGGQPSHVPLRADVGPRPQDDHQPERGRRVNEAADIQPAGEIENALPPLVQVPAGIGLHRVEPAGPQLFQPILPVVRHHPEIMNGSRHQGRLFPVPVEIAAFDRQSAHMYPPCALPGLYSVSL